MVRWSVLLGAAWLAAACGESSGARRGAPDAAAEVGPTLGSECDTCGKTADCAEPLRCIAGKCVMKGSPGACGSAPEADAVTPDAGAADVEATDLAEEPAPDTADAAAPVCDVECAPGDTTCLDGLPATCVAVDGCGTWAASAPCPPGHACQEGTCQCVSSCDAKECGDDGCGGDCGSCPDGMTCSLGQCLFSECDDGNAVAWDGCTKGQITEFQVNVTTPGTQYYPAVAGFGDGQFVVAWMAGNAIARVFAADGEAETGEIAAIQDTSGTVHAAVAVLSGSSFWSGRARSRTDQARASSRSASTRTGRRSRTELLARDLYPPCQDGSPPRNRPRRQQTTEHSRSPPQGAEPLGSTLGRGLPSERLMGALFVVDAPPGVERRAHFFDAVQLAEPEALFFDGPDDTLGDGVARRAADGGEGVVQAPARAELVAVGTGVLGAMIGPEFFGWRKLKNRREVAAAGRTDAHAAKTMPLTAEPRLMPEGAVPDPRFLSGVVPAAR